MPDDVYLVNKLCHRVFHDVAFRDAVKRDPVAAIASWPFSDEVRKALMAGNVAQLYEWGAHPFLLAHFTRWELFGITRPLYNQRMQNARDPLDSDGWRVRTQFPVA
jgi:Aromatic-ring-opening dioxygenase LigAB, LigA subunit